MEPSSRHGTIGFVRVAYFTDCYHEVNGVATTSRKLVEFASRRNFPFLAVHAGPENSTHANGSVTHVEVRRSWATIAVEQDFGFDPSIWRQLPRIRKELEAFRPDVVHVTSPGDIGLPGVWLAHSLRIPLVASWHTNLHEYAAQRLGHLLHRSPSAWAEKFSLRLLGLFYSAARATLAPNPEWVSWLKERTGKPSFLMSRGVDSILFNPTRRTVTDGQLRVGYVGRLSPEKNVRLLADIQRRLIRAGHSNVQFLVVGDGSELPWLRDNLINTTFTGTLRGELLAEAFANMDIFVFTSHTDTFGNVVQEAMASGVVPIVSSSGGPKYVIEPGVSGLTARDDNEFSAHVAALIENPGQLRLMRRAARTKAEGASWEQVFERVYEAYGVAVSDARISLGSPRSSGVGAPA